MFWLSWISGPLGATLLFGVISFLALREFITLAHTRRSDHRSLILAFFIVLPLQYVLVGLRSFDLFSVFIPVYVFLAIPVLSALAGDPERFLERNAKIQWGIMVCVFGLSHAPALLLLELPGYAGRGAFLLFFLVVVTASAQIVQELASRRLRRRPVARHIDRSFSYRAWGAGALAAALVGALLVWITPFRVWAGGGHGAGGRRLRHARRLRDAGAEEGRRRALLGQPRVRSPARSACSTAWRRCVLPRRCSSIRCAGIRAWRHEGPHPRHRPRAADHRLRRGRGRRPRDGLRGQRHHPHHRSGAVPTCRRG